MQLIPLVIRILISVSVVSAQNVDHKISRNKGNIFTNLTGHQEFEDHIVTSQLDSSNLIRMFYRGFREVYSRILPATGSRHNNERFQNKISPTTKFPCRIDGFRSTKVPKSVHQLRPGGKI